MQGISKYILIPTMISILFIAQGILLDAWLCKIGAIRGNKAVIIIGVVVMVFLKPFIFENGSWWIYGFAIILGQFAAHRSDLRETIKHGKWWWKEK